MMEKQTDRQTEITTLYIEDYAVIPGLQAAKIDENFDDYLSKS